MPSVIPDKMRRAAPAGKKAVQNFTVTSLPDGTITTTIEGGDGFVRLLNITAAEEVRVRLSDEEFAQLPRELQNEAHRFSIETVEVARVGPGQSLTVKPRLHVEGAIECGAPAGVESGFVKATLVIRTSTGSQTEVPIVFVIGDLVVEFLDDPMIAFRGQEVPVTVRLTLPVGGATELKLDSAEPFMFVVPQIVSLPSGGETTTTVSLFTDAVTPLGPASTNLRIDGFSGLATNFPFDVLVKNPFRVSASVIPASVTVPQGQEASCDIQISPQGASAPVVVKPGKLPFGVRMEPKSLTIPPDAGTQVRRVRLIVDKDAPTGTALWAPFEWRSTEGRGFFNTLLTITLTPETRTFAHQIVTPSGTALGGSVELTIRNDGSYTFRGHLHDSGLDSYEFRVNVALRSASAGFIALAEFQPGRVAGTLGSGSRDFDFEQRRSNDLLRTRWPDFRDGTADFGFEFDDKGLLGLLSEAANVALELIVSRVVLGPVVAPLIMIGSRLAASADLPITSPPGPLGAPVLAGAVLLFGPLAVFPAFLAGAAIASAANVKSRPMRNDEIQLAFTVFGDTLPISRIRITNLTRSSGVAFCTLHTPDRSIILGLGEDGFNGLDRDPLSPRMKTFIHELTHAWQFEHSSFGPAELLEQIRKPFMSPEEERRRYDFNPIDGRSWSKYTSEQQAEIVAVWYIINRSSTEAGLKSELFPYIQNHIRKGRA